MSETFKKSQLSEFFDVSSGCNWYPNNNHHYQLEIFEQSKSFFGPFNISHKTLKSGYYFFNCLFWNCVYFQIIFNTLFSCIPLCNNVHSSFL